MVLTVQTSLSFAHRTWWLVDRDDPRARALADRHYSRQTPGAAEFMSSGRTLVLLTECMRAVWGVIENMDPVGEVRWRCSIFRNEGAGLSSDLIREATPLTFEWWRNHYGALPSVPLRTEVDPNRTRRKRDPGRCFIRAGWRVVERDVGKRGLTVLEAPAAAQIAEAA